MRKTYLILSFQILFVNFCICQDIKINELMSSNISIYQDVDGDYPGWIELINTSNDTVDLTGYWLSDNFTNIQKWNIPSLKIAPYAYEIIYCSGKDIRVLGSNWNTLIDENSTWKYASDNSANDIPDNWRELSATLNWPSGQSGFGYGDNDDQTIIDPTIGLAIRKLFYIDSIDDIASMVLHVDYDDGFIAYINGFEIARENVCCDNPTLDQLALANHEAQIYRGGNPSEFYINDWNSVINEGYNVLAIQVHNVTENSSDLTIRPFLSIAHIEPDTTYQISSFLMDQLGSQSFGHYHTNFKIDNDGEEIVLSDTYGMTLDSIQFGVVPADISFGRLPDNYEQWAYFNIPTPLEVNWSEHYIGITESPVIYPTGGFYSPNTEVNIQWSPEGSQIYYTTDGSVPTTDDELFQNIIIDGTTTARFTAFKDGHLPSVVVTHTYFDNNDLGNLPVISIVTEPDHFFDNETGIYVLGDEATDWFPFWGANFWSDCPHSNMREYGCENWERPIHIEFFEPNGTLGFGIDAGVRIHGHWMRGLPQKCLAVIARGQYGQNRIEHQIFPNMVLDEFKSILIRQSGNDWSSTMIRDGLGAGLAREIDLDYQEHRQSILYINGVYWGIHNVREKISEHFLSSHHNIDLDNTNLDLVENSYGTWANYGSTDNWSDLIDFLWSNDISLDSNYQIIRDWVDIQEWINYLVIQLYAGNNDWPGGNYKRWYEEDKKWRFILNDLDAGFNQYPEEYNPPEENIFDNNGLDGGFPEYHQMMENSEFRNQFINTFADLFNTIFKPDRFSSIVDSLANILEPEMPYHVERWANTCSLCPGNWIGDGINSMDEWYEELDRLYEFTTVREEVGWGNILNEFNLNGYVQVNLHEESNEGNIKINSIIPSNYPWVGQYFKNNAITLSAVPNQGYEFHSWLVNGITTIEENPYVVSLSEFDEVDNAEISIEIFFQESSVVEPKNSVVVNEINYNSSDEYDSKDWIELINMSDSILDISDWIIRDNDWSHTFKIPYGELLEAGDFVVICRDTNAFVDIYPDEINIIGNLDFGFAESGDEVRIYDNVGNLIDSVHYSDDTPWPDKPDGNGASLELINPLLDNSIPTHWSSSGGSGTPGEINDSYIVFENNDDGIIPNYSYLGITYPNPFNMRINIPIYLEKKRIVKINIFNLLGESIYSAEYNLQQGKTTINWSGKTNMGQTISTGVYFINASWDTGSDIRKIVCVK